MFNLENEAVLRFLVALSGTVSDDSTEILGHQKDLWSNAPRQVNMFSSPLPIPTSFMEEYQKLYESTFACIFLHVFLERHKFFGFACIVFRMANHNKVIVKERQK